MASFSKNVKIFEKSIFRGLYFEIFKNFDIIRVDSYSCAILSTYRGMHKKLKIFSFFAHLGLTFKNFQVLIFWNFYRRIVFSTPITTKKLFTALKNLKMRFSRDFQNTQKFLKKRFFRGLYLENFENFKTIRLSSPRRIIWGTYRGMYKKLKIFGFSDPWAWFSKIFKFWFFENFFSKYSSLPSGTSETLFTARETLLNNLFYDILKNHMFFNFSDYLRGSSLVQNLANQFF